MYFFTIKILIIWLISLFKHTIVPMLLNVIISTKVNIYILKLDIDHNDNVLFSNEKDSADYNSFNHIQ
jgi:hypothetical protein